MELYLITGKKQLEVLSLQPRKLHSVVFGVFCGFSFLFGGQVFCLVAFSFSFCFAFFF